MATRVTDTRNKTIYRFAESIAVLPQHLQAFKALLESDFRFDRMQMILTEALIEQLISGFGHWEYGMTDLQDIKLLLTFLSDCHREPTEEEIERLEAAANRE